MITKLLHLCVCFISYLRLNLGYHVCYASMQESTSLSVSLLSFPTCSNSNNNNSIYLYSALQSLCSMHVTHSFIHICNTTSILYALYTDRKNLHRTNTLENAKAMFILRCALGYTEIALLHCKMRKAIQQ